MFFVPEINVEDAYSDDHTQSDQDHGEQQVLKNKILKSNPLVRI